MSETSFIELARQFVYDRFALEPVAATVAGYHEHDHRLGDLTADGFAQRRAFSQEWLARFEAFDTEGLAPAQDVDRQLILTELRGERALLPFERWKRQPGLYSDLITRGAYFALLREHAPIAERLAVLAERLAEAPAALESARANLDPALVPVEWVEIAARTAPAGAKFLRERIPKAVPDSAIGRAVGRTLLPAAHFAADALDRYAAWLRTDLEPKAKGKFAIGRDAYEALLKEKELLPYDVPTLRAFGEELFAETEGKIAAAAKAIGDDDWRDSVARFRTQHPEASELVATYRGEMQRSRAAVQAAQLATIPYGEDLVVEEMPDFQRTTYPYAAYVGAPPFEASRTGRFWVTLPLDGEDERTIRERLEGHPRAGIAVIACHEGYPGHHLQLTVAADHTSIARRSLRSNLMVEGWGLYVEELMTELGYLDSPDTGLLRLKDLLWRAARVVVDVGLCTGEMTFDEAVTYMVEKPKLEAPNALAEVRRYTLTPTQPSSYALGRQAILDLRAQARGKGWGMRLFHDKLLNAGSLPPKLLARDTGLEG
ncbi:MAG TPA: DUF885 domain-containing protein [Candidatus Limnocylindria bacterium]|nr:DUF885 domain-containing protein [Candidatus Limnocylindria bacterium]